MTPPLPLLCSYDSWGGAGLLAGGIPNALAFLGTVHHQFPFSGWRLQHFLSTGYILLTAVSRAHLNGASPSCNTFLKQLSLISDHSAQKSGQFSCILLDFSAAQATINYSFFPETLPSSDSSVPTAGWVISAGTSGLASFSHRVNVRLLQDEVLGCLLLSLCFLSQSDSCVYTASVTSHTTPPVNFQPHFSELGPSDPPDISTWMSKRHLRFDSFKPNVLSPQTRSSSMFLFSVNTPLSICTTTVSAQVAIFSDLRQWSLKWVCASQWGCKIAYWNTGRQ